MEGKWLKNLHVALIVALVDLLGAFAAMGVAIYLLGKEKIFTLIPPGNASIGYLLLVEAIFTFILVSTVLFVKYRTVTSTTDGMLSNLTVALSIYICIRMAGPLSGGGINPTIAVAILTTDKMVGFTFANGIHFLPYVLGPLIGGTVAAGLLLVTEKLSPEEVEEEGETEEVEIEHPIAVAVQQQN